MIRKRNRPSSWPVWLAVAALLWAGPVRAAAVEGVWERPNGKTKIRIEPCGDALCGVIVWIADTGRKDVKNPDPAQRGRAIVGSKMLYDLRPASTPGEWDGTLYDAENGKTYRSRVSVADGKLDLKGCQSVFCKEAEWTRASDASEASE